MDTIPENSDLEHKRSSRSGQLQMVLSRNHADTHGDLFQYGVTVRFFPFSILRLSQQDKLEVVLFK